MPSLHLRQRAQRHGVDQLKNRRVRPDTEGKREHRCRGEAGSAQQATKRMPEVIHKNSPGKAKQERPREIAEAATLPAVATNSPAKRLRLRGTLIAL